MKTITLFLSLNLIWTAQSCEFSDVSFDAGFSNARLDGCEQLSANRFKLTIDPENRPINSSPWFAFRITSQKTKKLRIQIDFGKDKSRYRPKISNNGKSWELIPHRVKNGDLEFKLTTTKKPLWVAAQEIIDNDFYHKWLNFMGELKNLNTHILGHSVQMRHIWALQHQKQDNQEWLIITGRMHPPEVTGAVALFPFVETLFSQSELSARFLDRFNVLVVPNLNPDGVEHGNWRHNANGVDLNRDWKNFDQPETQTILNRLNRITSSNDRIVFAVDFHSTSKNIFYTMPSDYGLYPPDMTERWLLDLDQHTPEFEVVMQPGNNPDRGVFKQFIADTYGVHAVTYEMDDQFDRKSIRRIAELAAKRLMQTLLATKPEAFKPKQ